MLSEWLLNSGAYMHWIVAMPVWYAPCGPHAGVLEDVRPLGQVVDEEVAGRVAGRFVVAQPVLVLVVRKHV